MYLDISTIQRKYLFITGFIHSGDAATENCGYETARLLLPAGTGAAGGVLKGGCGAGPENGKGKILNLNNLVGAGYYLDTIYRFCRLPGDIAYLKAGS